MKTSNYVTQTRAFILIASAVLSMASLAVFAQATPNPGSLEGVWQGALGSGAGKLPVVLTIS
jgi:hypothetical protein